MTPLPPQYSPWLSLQMYVQVVLRLVLFMALEQKPADRKTSSVKPHPPLQNKQGGEKKKK